MSKSKKNHTPPRWLYWFVLILSVLIIILSPQLPFLMCVIFLLFGVFGVYYSIVNLFLKLRKSKPAAPSAPRDKPAPAPDAPATPDAPTSPARVHPSEPVPDGYLPDGRPFYSSDYRVAKTIHTKIVGVTFRDDYPLSRQEIISSSCEGQQLQLRPFTYRGAPAYSVVNLADQRLGNLSSEIASVIHDLPNDWFPYVEISEITGGHDGQYYGCNIVITMYVKK